MDDLLARARVVLCRPNHPGNIGAAARAMKTMGLTDLRLIAPQRFPAEEARWMASSASDVLDASRVGASLAEAIGDCVGAFALSARPREWSPPVLAARDAALLACELLQQGPVALVFGSESAGLTNDEVFACQHLVHIPTANLYRSLNLAQAVQIVCYELHVAAGSAVPEMRAEKLATLDDLEGLYRHLEDAALSSGFLAPQAGSRLRERWRRLLSRVPRLEREEVNILRGLLKAMQQKRGE